MLYLAEVQKKAKLIGSSKAELKLLAQQRSEDRWQSLPNGETMSSEKANEFNDGSLVLVDVSDKSGQIQRVQSATRLIVNSLQNSSRLQEKLKGQEDEIEQWKQSLTYQSQELNRREMEMEARREQMQQLEEEMAQLEQEKQEALALRQTAQQLREELDRREQEMRVAQEQLAAERQQLESRKEEIQASAVVNSDQMVYLQECLDRFSQVVIPSDAVREHLTYTLETLNQQKETLAQHWQYLEQHQAHAYQRQEEVNQLSQNLRQAWESWYHSQAELEQAKADFAAQKQVLAAYQEQAEVLQQQLQGQETLYQRVSILAGGLGDLSPQINLESLEAMPIPELEERVQELQKDYEKNFNFVNDQEEELRLLSQEIETKKAQISQSNEFDMTLENELVDLEAEYRLFDESVLPQRQRLQEAKAILAVHQKVLARRQGAGVTEERAPAIDLKPVLAEIDTQRQHYFRALEQINTQIQQIENTLQHTENGVTNGEAHQQRQRQELQNLEDELLNQHAAVAELWGKVKTYQELLQPTQETLTDLDQKLQSVNQELNRVQEGADHQLQLLAEVRQALTDLTA